MRTILLTFLGLAFSAWERFAKARNRAYSAVLCQRFKASRGGFSVQFPASIAGASHISIGRNFTAGLYFRMEAIQRFGAQQFDPEIEIGDMFMCLNFVHIGAVNRIRIGDGVLFGSHVTVVDHNHGYYDSRHQKDQETPSVPPLKRKLTTDAEVYIGNHVWVGEGATILPGSWIGDGAVIGANTIVKGVIPAGSIVSCAVSPIVKSFDQEKGSWTRTGHTDE